jgi:ribA/ribD-fused uncharacterized protein
VAKSSEHLYNALKSVQLTDRRWVLDAGSPAQAKKRGRLVHLQEDWDSGFKNTAMHLTLVLKFSANFGILARLVSTNNEQLVEGNFWHDNYWGDCFCPKCQNIPGQNNLGILLMQVRTLFQQIG